jgi:hypothetical protein
MQLSTKTLLALLPYFVQVHAGASGIGTTTRYWDCCKPSCAWPGKATLAPGSTPVQTCDISDSPLTDANAGSGCGGGTAYMCSNESPWSVTEDLAYGYAAVNIAGGSEESWCCACYELTFTSGVVAGKKMIVQATNTGGDLGSNQFDISVCYFPFMILPTQNPDSHPLDTRRRRRDLQRLHCGMGGPFIRLGSPIWRYILSRRLLFIPRSPPIRLRMALRLV